MTTRGYFARNPDGSLVEKRGCQTPGCSYPTYHCCLFGKEDNFGIALRNEISRVGKNVKTSGPMDEDQKDRIREGVNARIAERRAVNRPRDERILACWNNQQISKEMLAAEFNIGVVALQGILKRFEAEGLLTRPYNSRAKRKHFFD